MERLTNQQVQEQQMRFDKFFSKVDLAKVGSRYFHFIINDNQDGKYNWYCYLLRVLRLVAKVEGCMYHPARLAENQHHFYREILERAAISAALDAIKK